MRLEPAIPPGVLAAIRAPFEAARGEAVSTPTAEPLGLYLDLAGEALRERLFLVQAPGREEYCLRPDFTLGVARAHIERGFDAGRYAYEGAAFRLAPAAQPEQYLQIGLEAYGVGDPAADDAAMAALAWRGASAGGREDLSLVLGDVALFGAFVRALGLEPAVAARLSAAYAHPIRLERELAADPAQDEPGGLAALLQGLDETRAAAVLQEIWSLAGVEPVGGRGPEEIVRRLIARAAAGPRLTDGERAAVNAYLAIVDTPAAAFDRIAQLALDADLDAALAAWRRRIVALAEVPQDRISFAAGLHRPFSYYDGAFFEVRSAALGEDTAVAAGGRYDSLLGRLGHRRTQGAVGCMVRPGLAWKDGGS